MSCLHYWISTEISLLLNTGYFSGVWYVNAIIYTDNVPTQNITDAQGAYQHINVFVYNAC